jgi:hypothetical protein
MYFSNDSRFGPTSNIFDISTNMVRSAVGVIEESCCMQFSRASW